MTSQNTSRLWFVIGSIIVGAALIFFVNDNYPQLFAQVVSSFDEKSIDMAVEADSLYVDVLDFSRHQVSQGSVPDEETGVLTTSEGNRWHSTVGPIDVVEHESYIFTAPLGIAEPLITYYDVEGRYLGHLKVDEVLEHGITIRTPEGTDQVLLSAGDVTVDATRHEVSQVSEWRLMALKKGE